MVMSDKEQVQMVKSWWQEYGYHILFTILIVIIANFGWRYFKRHQQVYLEQASVTYSQMLMATDQKKTDESKLFGERLIKNYPSSLYASLAALILAKNAAQDNDLKLAVERLQFVIKKASNKNLREIARLRAARVLVAMKQSKEALNLLATIDDDHYVVAINEITGDALLDLGKTKEAEEAYRKARDASAGRVPQSPFLKMKLQQF